MAGLGGPAGAGAVGALTLGGVVTGLVPLAALGVLGTQLQAVSLQAKMRTEIT